jgi:hypothetical protein
MRTRATKQQIAVTIGLLIAIAAAGFWWWPHIRWSYMLSRNNIKIAPVKVVEMPPAKPAAGWFTCRAGAVTFQLPPAMAEEAERTVSATPQALTLTTASHELTVLVSTEVAPNYQPFLEQLAATMHFSPIQFIAESFRTGTDDFRWTMSRTELYRYQMLLNLSSVYPHENVVAVETTSDAAKEGNLVRHDSGSQAMFEWRLKSGKTAGFLRFRAIQGELNVDDVRAACQSVTCDETKLGPALSKRQLAVLADTLEITPN